jgi:TolB protein
VSPDWGANGLIAYAGKVGGRFQIFTIDPRNRRISQITSDFADHEDPSWAPDGRHLAVAISRAYKSRVYLIDTMGGDPILLTDYEGDWYAPEWSP